MKHMKYLPWKAVEAGTTDLYKLLDGSFDCDFEALQPARQPPYSSKSAVLLFSTWLHFPGISKLP